MEIKVEKLMDNSPGSSLISSKDEGSFSLGEKFRRNIYIYSLVAKVSRSLRFPSFPFGATLGERGGKADIRVYLETNCSFISP